MKLQTPVQITKSTLGVSYDDRIVMLGSCFSDSIGNKMLEAGFDVLVNPFGTLYNPISIGNSVKRLQEGKQFEESDCVQMGAGSDLICSFSHHTSFARKTREEFLSNANSSLNESSLIWKNANKVIITLGTAWRFTHLQTGKVVSNCLKRNPKEFSRDILDVDSVVKALLEIIDSNPEKKFIFTVSPIRHMADGAHGNQISKSTLLLAIDKVVGMRAGSCEYFPSYEIVMDELRDYRFYCEDMVHPSAQAVGYIWERFIDSYLPKDQIPTLEHNLKAYARSQHRDMH